MLHYCLYGRDYDYTRYFATVKKNIPSYTLHYSTVFSQIMIKIRVQVTKFLKYLLSQRLSYYHDLVVYLLLKDKLCDTDRSIWTFLINLRATRKINNLLQYLSPISINESRGYLLAILRAMIFWLLMNVGAHVFIYEIIKAGLIHSTGTTIHSQIARSST